MILALGSASFHVNGAFNRKGLKATNPVTSILQPKQLYPHFHPPWKKTRDASSSLKITLETSVSGSGCIKLLKVTGDFSQLLSALQSVMVFPVLFITFFSDSFSIVREKIPQSTGNCCRKSHVILSISMKLGPGPAVFAQTEWCIFMHWAVTGIYFCDRRSGVFIQVLCILLLGHS